LAAIDSGRARTGSAPGAAGPTRQFRIGQRQFRGLARRRAGVPRQDRRISARSAYGTCIAIEEVRPTEGSEPMTFKLGLREGVMSAAVFGGVMFALVAVDPRVRDHVSDLVAG